MDDRFQAFLFTPQFLGMLGIIPDFGAFEFCIYKLQAFGLGIVVKDTSEAPSVVRRSLPGGRLAGFGVRLP
jgi:hypothetical protein